MLSYSVHTHTHTHTIHAWALALDVVMWLRSPAAVAAYGSSSCVVSIALDVVAAVAESGGCGCFPVAFRTRHLQCAAEELLLQELVPSYCVATGGRWFCSLLMGNQWRDAGAKILGKQRKKVKNSPRNKSLVGVF